MGELDLQRSACYSQVMRICATNPYVEMMYTEFKDWSFDEKALENRGLWRSQVFEVGDSTPLDLEIGTGNGTHFAHYAEQNPDRCIVGLELKFKTLVQSIRRSVKAGCTNSRMARVEAEKITQLFGPEEINNVYIHFPDPWPKKRHFKNRLIQTDFLENLYEVMKKGGVVEFKTDHHGYFQWATRFFGKSSFEIQFFTEDLHNSSRSEKNFVTHFESLFLEKRQPIYCCLLKKN